MRIRTLSIGKTNVEYVRQGLEEFNSRISKYCKYEWDEIPDLKNRAKLPKNDLKVEEAKLILKRLVPNERLILLDEGGRSLSSVKFASWLSDAVNLQAKDVCFVIGGAYGFSQELYDRSEMKISLSPMTFNHQLIRLIFAEQLYRGFTIIRGEPYHHE
ncbi:23S rRNA (pseudouridine(1915)-N(3))-methyltransferase RlmH [Salibacteraceae bacterium]|nr:23S rRNA (pseudouridine(1915)-N(3))-methyltransferase RlmH [Salibacteraceae bacterium]